MRYLIPAFIVFAVGMNMLCSQIPSKGRAVNAVENLGWRDVHVVSRSPAFEVFGGCRENDVTKFKVAGTLTDGTHRTVTVCAPILGGYTIRS